uniref:Tubby C-terminal domain-containing protein n=1 Tax=Aegilops tauschii subsp. strangulata TaxID=200361 RepID=A0A453MY49_AEGTS
AVVLKVKGAIFSIRSRRTILDGAGMPLLTMQEKVFSMHHRWEVFRGDSTNAGNTAQQVCDFKIKGSYFDRSCVFYLGDSNNMVAQMSRKLTVSNVLLGRDTFSVTVFPHVDYVFIASLVVILDEVHRDKRDD